MRGGLVADGAYHYGALDTLRHGLTESQLAIWSISHAEQARATEGVLGDSFPAFALKCLAVLGEMPLCHRGARSSDHADGLTVRKANSKLLDAKVTFRGAKMNQTMANGVLIFRNTVDSGGLRMFADKEKILGVTAGTIKKPRAKVFDTSFGQPLGPSATPLPSLVDIVRGRRCGNERHAG